MSYVYNKGFQIKAVYNVTWLGEGCCIYKPVQGLRFIIIHHWIYANQLKETKSLYQLGDRSRF